MVGHSKKIRRGSKLINILQFVYLQFQSPNPHKMHTHIHTTVSVSKAQMLPKEYGYIDKKKRWICLQLLVYVFEWREAWSQRIYIRGRHLTRHGPLILMALS